MNTIAGVLQPFGCAAYPNTQASNPQTRPRPHGLLGLAPGGVCHAVTVTDDAVGTYSTVSPSPARNRQSVLCGTFPRVTPGGRYPPPCSMEPGLSSTTHTAAAITRMARPTANSTDIPASPPQEGLRWTLRYAPGCDRIPRIAPLHRHQLPRICAGQRHWWQCRIPRIPRAPALRTPYRCARAAVRRA